VVFKKQLTPMRPHSRGMRGQVVKQRGKGSTQQDQPPPGGRETVTGADPMQRMMNQYPKPPPPVPPPAPMPASAPGQAIENDESQ
jgi:hypothetical protein